jgi:hypothetical protein
MATGVTTSSKLIESKIFQILVGRSESTAIVVRPSAYDLRCSA